MWMPGVGDRDVDPTEALDGSGDRPLQGVGVGDVGLEPGRPIAELRRPLLEQLGLEPDQGDVRALRMQALGRCGTDAAGGAGDEGGAAGDVERAAGHQVDSTSSRDSAAGPLPLAEGAAPSSLPTATSSYSSGFSFSSSLRNFQV